MHVDVVVVGGGLFGSAAYHALERAGCDVLMVDDMRLGRGSEPAGCLMKPSWLSSLSKEQILQSMDQLDELYGVESVPFNLLPTRSLALDIKRVRPSQVLAPKKFHRYSKVVSVAQVNKVVSVRTADDTYFYAKHVILACGQWGNQLAPTLAVKAQWGWSFLWDKVWPGPGILQPWAPYRQLIGFQIEPSLVWSGDGTALKAESFTNDRLAVSLNRVASALGYSVEQDGPRVLAGGRPYAERTPGLPCVFEQDRRIFLINGGAKNGTIAAGWCAAELVKRVK